MKEVAANHKGSAGDRIDRLQAVERMRRVVDAAAQRDAREMNLVAASVQAVGLVEQQNFGGRQPGGGVIFQRIQQRAQPTAGDDGIGVEERQVIAAGMGSSQVAAGGKAQVLGRFDQDDLGEMLADAQRTAIAGGVIHHDHLSRRGVILEDGFQAALQLLPTVVTDDDQAGSRRSHRGILRERK